MYLLEFDLLFTLYKNSLDIVNIDMGIAEAEILVLTFKA